MEQIDKVHMEDHKKILAQMDVTKELAETKMEVVLLKERITEMKSDKESGAVQQRWLLGMAFVIVMGVAGSAISQSSLVKVLQEKVKEQKSEIEKLTNYVNDVQFNLQNQIDAIDDDLNDHSH